MDELWIDRPDPLADASAPKRSRVADPYSVLYWLPRRGGSGKCFRSCMGRTSWQSRCMIYRLRMVRERSGAAPTVSNERLLAEWGSTVLKYRALGGWLTRG